MGAEHSLGIFIEPEGCYLRQNDYDLKPPVRTMLLSSDHFIRDFLDFYRKHNPKSPDSDYANFQKQKAIAATQKKWAYKAPVFYPDLEHFQMNMHTKSGVKYTFVLTGIYMHHPNMCCSNGYGSDDWFFHSKYNGEDHILHFCNDAAHGTMWCSSAITNSDAKNLLDLSDEGWIDLTRHDKVSFSCLHPDSIEDARKILKRTNTRTGPLGDTLIYGLD